jgi:hypothetical protein
MHKSNGGCFLQNQSSHAFDAYAHTTVWGRSFPKETSAQHFVKMVGGGCHYVVDDHVQVGGFVDQFVSVRFLPPDSLRGPHSLWAAVVFPEA